MTVVATTHLVPLPPVLISLSSTRHVPDISQATPGTVNSQNINVGNANVSNFGLVTTTLVCMARRSGLCAVAAAHDAGLSAPVLAGECGR